MSNVFNSQPVTFDDLDPSKLVGTDSSSYPISVDLSSFLTGTANQVNVTDDTDGTATLSLPQSIHTGADVVFNTVDGRDVSADGATLDSLGTDVSALQTEIALFNDELQNLTTAEIQQLQNIGTTTISGAQWVYLGTMDQDVSTGASPVFGNTLYNPDSIEINTYGSGNRYAYIDFHGDDTYTDYGLRIIRQNGGPNTVSTIDHRGTGEFQINTVESADIVLQTSATERMRIDGSGDGTYSGNFYVYGNQVDMCLQSSNVGAGTSQFKIGYPTIEKCAIIMDYINNWYRGDLHLCVDTTADGNPVALTDSKLKIDALTGDVKIANQLGIGTDPSALFHATDGTGTWKCNSNSTNPYFSVSNGTITTLVGAQASGSQGAVGTKTNHELDIVTNDTARVTVGTGGDVTTTSYVLSAGACHGTLSVAGSSATLGTGGAIVIYPNWSGSSNDGTVITASSATNRITVYKTGFYRIEYSMTQSGSSWTDLIGFFIYKNGSELTPIHAYQTYSNMTGFANCSNFIVVSLTATDYIELYYQPSVSSSSPTLYGSLTVSNV